MRAFLAVLLLAAALAASSCAATDGDMTSTDVTTAPPAPVITFTTEPEWRHIERQDVYVLADTTYAYDVLRQGTTYYVYNDGYWYNATDFRGPYLVIARSGVPKQFFQISPTDYRWRHLPLP